MHVLRKGTGVLLLTLGVTAAAAAQTASQADLEARMEAQSERIERLEQALDEAVSKQRVFPPDVKFDEGTRRVDPEKESLFRMKVGGRMQARYTGFSRSDRNYDFGNGSTGTQENLNDFEIERGRLEFSGIALDPDLHFYLNLDFDTDDNHDVKAHDFWVNYEVDEAFDLHVGKAFVPGSREWLDGSTSTHLADRSLATSFFRPDRSLGIWAIGDLGVLKYHAMVANGFNTTDLEREDMDNDFTYAASIWSDVVGEYGKGRADLEYHDELAVRVGSSFTYSPVSANADSEPVGEADAVRLSNGLRLDSTGALAPGVTVSEYDIYLYAVDFSAKLLGFGLNSEAYYRDIQNIQGDGVIGLDSYADKGAYVDIGYFVIARKLEPVLRYSIVDGAYGNSHEYAGGINYYINETHLNKLTLDVAYLEDSGVDSSGPNYLVGQDGTLYRLQWQVGF